MSAEAHETAALRRRLAEAERELRRLRKALSGPPLRYELADVLKVSERTIARWRSEGLPANASADQAAEWRRDRQRKPRGKRPKVSRRVS